MDRIYDPNTEEVPIGGRIRTSDLKGDYTVLPPTYLQQLNKKTKQNKSLGQKILDTGTKVANFFGAKGISEQFGADIAQLRSKPDAKKFVSYPTQKEVVGSAIQTGANFIPGVGPEVGILGKIAAGAATGYAFDVGSKLQTNQESPFKPGVGTAVGTALPIAGAVVKPVLNVGRRLIKGLASGLSGASTEMIDRIVDNPRVAQEVSKKLQKTGNSKVLEDNAKTIINGISKIKSEARAAYGKGLEELADTDINPVVFREHTQTFLDKHGVHLKDGVRDLGNVEFSDSKNLQKASDLIDRLHDPNLDGKSLRKLADDIESARYKTATSDERLSFNAFLKDMSETVKDAVHASTGKFGEINKQFSTDMQLAEAVEGIFSDVDFKNLPEVVKVSRKLERLFSQSGLEPQVVEDFLKRIGVSPEDFKTSEAVRQISNKSQRSNEMGASVGELVRAGTSAVITPQMVKSISIATGITEQKASKILTKMNPNARKIFIQTVLPSEKAKTKASGSLVTNLSIATGLAKEELVPFLNSLQPAMRNAVIQALIQQNNQK